MSGGPLHHQFKDCAGWDVLEVVLPQNSACLAVDPEELHKEKAKGDQRQEPESLLKATGQGFLSTMRWRSLVPVPSRTP